MKIDQYATDYYPVDLSSTDYEGEDSKKALNIYTFGFILTDEKP